MFIWTEESAAFWADSAAYTKSYERLAQRAAAHLVPGGSLFEGGCGLGHLSLALARQGYAVTAMDDPNLVDRLHAAGVTFSENPGTGNMLLLVLLQYAVPILFYVLIFSFFFLCGFCIKFNKFHMIL